MVRILTAAHRFLGPGRVLLGHGSWLRRRPELIAPFTSAVERRFHAQRHDDASRSALRTLQNHPIGTPSIAFAANQNRLRHTPSAQAKIAPRLLSSGKALTISTTTRPLYGVRSDRPCDGHLGSGQLCAGAIGHSTRCGRPVPGCVSGVDAVLALPRTIKIASPRSERSYEAGRSGRCT